MRSLRFRAWIIAAGAAALAVIAAVIAREAADARLVRGDPDRQVFDPLLMRAQWTAGKAGFAQRCAACHRANGKGDGRGVPDLTDNDWLYGAGKPSDLQQIVVHGVRAPDSRTWRLAEMPPFAQPSAAIQKATGIQALTAAEINDLIAFLWARGKRQADPAAAARGGALYRGRGECFDCHGDDARGDPSIGAPNLTDSIWLYGGDREAVFRSIALGRAGQCPAWGRRLSAPTIRRIVLYTYTMSHPKAVPPGVSGAKP